MVYLVKKKVKGNVYLYLEESARVNGKPKRIWSHYLGPEKDVKKISTLSLDIAEMEIVHFEFGFPVALMQIAEKLDLIGIINHATAKRNQGMSVGQYLAINALNRCIKPLSKRQILDWFNTTYLAQIFPQIDTYLNSMAYSNHYEYLTDIAIERIEKDLISVLASEFQVDMSHLIYDPTNFYTYIQEPEDEDELDYAQFGHGKEHRDNLRIVGLVLVCTEDGGIPLLSEVYPGNIPDVTLFKSQADKIKKNVEQFRFGEEIQLLLDFDKGNNSLEGFTTLDSSPILFIASIRPSMVKDLASIPAQNFPRFTLPNGKEVGVLEFEREFYGKSRRLIVQYNPDQAKRSSEMLLKRLEQKLEELVDYFAMHLNIKKWRSIDAVKTKLEAIIGQKYLSYFNLNLANNSGKLTFTASLNYPQLAHAQALFGKSYLISNHPSKSAFELIRLFRQQITVEQAFNYLKSPDFLRTRPIFHHKNICIRGHLFSCVLGLLLLTLLTREVQKTIPELTLEMIVQTLTTIKASHIYIPGCQKPLRKLCKISQDAQKLVNCLNLASYL